MDAVPLDNSGFHLLIEGMTTETQTEKSLPEASEKKPGLFQRLFKKLDDKMKEKAEASSDCCCDDDSGNSSGKKCC